MSALVGIDKVYLFARSFMLWSCFWYVLKFRTNMKEIDGTPCRKSIDVRWECKNNHLIFYDVKIPNFEIIWRYISMSYNDDDSLAVPVNKALNIWNTRAFQLLRAHFLYHRNSNSREKMLQYNAIVDYQIPANFRMCYDLAAVVPCAQFCDDYFLSIQFVCHLNKDVCVSWKYSTFWKHELMT